MGGAQHGARGTAGHPAQVSAGNTQQAKAGCVPHTFRVLTGATDGGLKRSKFTLSRAGGQTSEIEVLAGPRSPGGSWEHPSCVLPCLVAPSIPWLVAASFQSFPHRHTAFSPVSLRVFV